MQDLIKLEQFELEVLDKLNSSKLLTRFVFGGGTMLRLCFGLSRFSVDLDFWVVENLNFKKLFRDLKECLTESYALKDHANKFHTLLFEIKSGIYPRSLKIEVRKEVKKITPDTAIAYSKHSNTQVLLRVVSLQDMMDAKIEAFLTRKEIRDVFDLEFLLKKGTGLNAPAQKLKKLLIGIDALTKRDYRVKLCSLLEKEQRPYYIENNFKVLKLAIKEKINIK
ncbi:MAG: hypothetical protein A2166_06225 [Omnitrophica WOR_2 bacterium RBG_13_41_10]|nr:MAG: hypothetical protein A2166_06225 [Omnitrophica WOR_2 bacterium RBG_13_41_10]